MLFSYPIFLLFFFFTFMNFDVVLKLWIYYFAWQGLIGLLVKLSSGSVVAFRTLYELNISITLRDILSAFDLSHGVSTSQLVGGHCNRVWGLDLFCFCLWCAAIGFDKFPVYELIYIVIVVIVVVTSSVVGNFFISIVIIMQDYS